jgi:hypothetical protein
MYAKGLAAIHQYLSDEEFQAEWNAGITGNVEQALSFARDG